MYKLESSLFHFYLQNLDEDLLPEAVSDLFGKRILFEVSVDADNIKGKSSHYVVRIATADRELIEEFAALPVKQVLFSLVCIVQLILTLS